MSHRPQVSVIVPSYNKPEYLPECLESIRAQTFTDWECIVVSDGSPRVEEIRAAVAAMGEERFRLLEPQENRGPAAARNLGARSASGDFVIWVDEDDRIRPECLEKEVRAIEQTGCHIVCCGVTYFGGREGLYRAHIPLLEEVLHRQPLIAGGFLMRKEVWTQVGGWDENPVLRSGVEDHDWWIRLIASGLQIELLDAVYYEYRVPREEDEAKKSRNHQAALNSVMISRYIIEKHRALYDMYPWARKKYLRRAYLKEADILHARRLRLASALRYLQAMCVGGELDDGKRAIRELASAVFGEKSIERFSVWCRRLLGKGEVSCD